MASSFDNLMFRLLNSGREPGQPAPQNALAAALQSYGPGALSTPGLSSAPAMAPSTPAQRRTAPASTSGYQMPERAPQGNSGGFLSGLGDLVQGLVAPQSRGRNATIDWLQGQGLDEGTATLLAGNKGALQKFLLERTQGADPKEALNIEKLQLEIGNLRNPTTDDIKEFNFAKKGGYQGTFTDYMQDMKKASASSTNVNLNQDGEVFAGLPKDVRDEMFTRRTEAQDAADLIDVTNQGLQLLDQGAITGAGSGAKVAAVKWAQTLGVPVPDDIATVVNNTQAYRSIMAKAVGKVIKNFGSGTGLSDADRQYAERLAGGDTTLNEPAIRRILAAGAQQAQRRVDGYSAIRDKVLNGDLGALLNVQAPEAYKPKALQPTQDQQERQYLDNQYRQGTTSSGVKWSIER